MMLIKYLLYTFVTEIFHVVILKKSVIIFHDLLAALTD